jgi:TonB family protein
MNTQKQSNALATLKKYLILPFSVLIFSAFSCNNNDIQKKENAGIEASLKQLSRMELAESLGVNNTTEPYVVVPRMPQFPGGEKEMMNFIKTNIKYPEKARKDNVEGTVIVDFVINREGNITDTKILRSTDKSLTKEALKIIHSMPKWAPGIQEGESVSVSYALPISFNLPNSTSS